MPSAVSITVSLRTATTGALIDLQRALHRLEEHADAGDKALGNLTASLVSLAPAAIPVAAAVTASMGPLVAQLGAAAVASGVFAAALIPQFKSISDATKAHDKYTAAVGKSGAGSKQAAQAESAYQQSIAGMPEVTRKAAAALGNLTGAYQQWSNSLADSTMPVAIRSFALLENVLPKLSPMVVGASAQFDRLVHVLGGGLESPSLNRLSAEFNNFAVGALKKTIDEVIHFSRVLAQGDFNKGPFREFLTYAKANAPLVKETLSNLVAALLHLGQAASDAGPGMLTIVNTLAKLAASIPAPLLTRLLQLYTALRLIKATSAGILVVTSAMGRLERSLVDMTRASAGAGGGLAGVRAALGSLSTGAKVGGVIAVIAGVALAIKSLQGSGRAAPDVAKMATALGQLGRTGKNTGEAARIFGGDFSKLSEDLAKLGGKKDALDHFNDVMNAVFTLGLKGSNGPKQAKKDIDAVDSALAQLVQNGNADLAAAAVTKLSSQLGKGGQPAKELTDKLEKYKAALADAQFEAELTADSMGLFGKQAQDTQRALDAQKQSADGLRQSIQALNDVNRAGIDGMIGFEQAIDDGNKSLKENGKSLKMVHGQLVLTSQKARDEASALNDLAAKTDSATASARDQGKSWGEVYGIYDRGRTSLINLATSMGLTKDQAKQLANQILRTPDKTASLKGDLTDLEKKLSKAKADLKAAPNSKKTEIRGNIVDLQNKIAAAKRALASVKGKTVHVDVIYDLASKGVGVAVPGGGRYAHGGVVGAASGGPRSRMTLVGEQGPELVDLAAGSRVHTANATRQMLTGAGGGGGDMAPIALTVNIGGVQVGAALIDPLRGVIRDRGGNVQVVLGQRGA